MTSLTSPDLQVIYETIQRVKQIKKQEPEELSNLFMKDPRLIISPSNRCHNHCSHCVAESAPDGEVMPYHSFTKIPSSFIKIFSVADFGRRGNPLLYHSDGHDLVDLLEHLNKYGINEFTLALTTQKKDVPVIGKLEDFVSEKEAPIETMVTYHHYLDGLDTVRLAQDFNSTLKNYIGFSRKIVVSLLGDIHSQQNPTKAEEVQKAFQDNWNLIFADLDVEDKEGVDYKVEYGNKQTEISIPPVDTRVYPLGEFREYLSQKGILEQYEGQFEQSLSDYVCPDLVKWPGIILEPNGDLNLCASFEAIIYDKAIVSNIFNKSFSEVQEELKAFHQKELDWFIQNLPDVIEGKVSTCKLKNDCYRKGCS